MLLSTEMFVSKMLLSAMGSRSLMLTSAKSDPRLLIWASPDPVHKSDFYKLLLFDTKDLKIREINIFMKIRFIIQLNL